MKLTEEGKRVLGRVADNHSEIKQSETPQGAEEILNIMRAVAKIKRENPDFEINFDIKLKGAGDSA